MSGIMSLFSNLVNGAPTAPASSVGATAAPNTPGSIPASTPNTGVATPNAAPNGVLPTATPDANPKPTATPLDDFKDLWSTAPIDPNAPPAQTGVFGTVDPQKFMEAAGKIDFAKVITPEQLQAISTGGEGAVSAFAAALNSVAQTTYAQSAYASTKIVEQAISRARETFASEIPAHIKRAQLGDNLRAENPIFSNPAVTPIISALESQMAVKFPNATATELTQMAKSYVEALGTSFSPKPQVPANTGNLRGGKADTDWTSFLD